MLTITKLPHYLSKTYPTLTHTKNVKTSQVFTILWQYIFLYTCRPLGLRFPIQFQVDWPEVLYQLPELNRTIPEKTKCLQNVLLSPLWDTLILIIQLPCVSLCGCCTASGEAHAAQNDFSNFGSEKKECVASQLIFFTSLPSNPR